MVKHNNQLVKNHFRKDWEGNRFQRTWFDQPARKNRRRKTRQAKAARIYPRPAAGLLRPLVHGQTLKYTSKVKQGRGFTLQELKQAGINSLQARGIGISVDFRRNDRSIETLTANVQRLKLYKSKLLVFPRKAGKPKKGDATVEDLSKVVQRKGTLPARIIDRKDKARVITDKEKTDTAYGTIRRARTKVKKVGFALRKKKTTETGDKGGKKADKGDDAGDE